MSRYFVIATLICITLSIESVEAQGPRTTEYLKSIVDSVKNEFEDLEILFKANLASEPYYESIKHLNKLTSIRLEYINKEGVNILFLNESEQSVLHLLFDTENISLIYSKRESRILNQFEDSLLTVEKNLLKISKQELNLNQDTDKKKVLRITKPSQNGFTQYVLFEIGKFCKIPFGAQYIFTTDANGTLLTKRKIHEDRNERDLIERGLPISALIVSDHSKRPMIEALDIVLFNYHSSYCNVFRYLIHSRRDRKYFMFDAKSNLLSIEEKFNPFE